MKEVFHYHITVSGISSEQLGKIAKSLKAKATTIDLFNDKFEQKDRMITKYSNKYQKIRSEMFQDVQKLKDIGFEVKRAKIEQVTDRFSFNEEALYSEAHIKVSDHDLKRIDGLHLSNNPVDGTRFYNARAYTCEQFLDAARAMTHIDNKISEQYELCLFDSNQSHDIWWTDGS